MKVKNLIFTIDTKTDYMDAEINRTIEETNLPLIDLKVTPFNISVIYTLIFAPEMPSQQEMTMPVEFEIKPDAEGQQIIQG